MVPSGECALGDTLFRMEGGPRSSAAPLQWAGGHGPDRVAEKAVSPHLGQLQERVEEVSVLMAGLRRKLQRGSAGLLRNPRHFLQLLLPASLMLAGWLALAIDWQRSALILMSAALMAFSALLWLRLRRLQGRIDQGLRNAAARTRPIDAGILAEPPAAAAVGGDEESQLPTLNAAPAAAALAAGVPAGLFAALEMAALEESDDALLVVPGYTRTAARNWAEGTTPARWTVVDEGLHDGAQRSRAAGLDVVVIVDGEDEPAYEGVLDQSFFWWLPPTAQLFMVSRDTVAFASRLAAAHEVGLSLGESTRGAARAIVSRHKG